MKAGRTPTPYFIDSSGKLQIADLTEIPQDKYNLSFYIPAYATNNLNSALYFTKQQYKYEFQSAKDMYGMVLSYDYIANMTELLIYALYSETVANKPNALKYFKYNYYIASSSIIGFPYTYKQNYLVDLVHKTKLPANNVEQLEQILKMYS